MGCSSSVATKPSSISNSKVIPVSSLLPPEKAGSFRVRILEAIKKRDVILFEKILQQHQVKYSDLAIGYEQKRSVLHFIAELNFVDGMAMMLDYVSIKEPAKLPQLINAVDINGNTPAMICCSLDAPETLEILTRYESINVNVKNFEGKSAMELAAENSSPCVNILSIPSSANTRATITKHMIQESVDAIGSPRNLANNTSFASNSKKRDRRASVEPGTPLSSVLSLTKETSVKIQPNTKLFSLMNELKGADGNFIDDEFPHDIYSIIEGDYMEGFGGESNSAIKWLRPHEFLNPDLKKIKVFEGIDLNDVSRSHLAGCDLYSALAAMTEFPQRLLNTFSIKEVNKYGAYSVKFLISGIPVEIMLDDYFPCSTNQELLYSKPLTNELWFLLLEKAFAKLYGSYNEIRNVPICEALELMTSMPSSQQDMHELDSETLWNRLIEYDQKNYIVCAGTYSQDEESGKNRILTVVSMYDTQQYKIIKLRNHFQDFQWDGMFTEKSKSSWTKELKEEIGYTKGERSCVYMELQEFKRHFGFLAVCHYQENWIRNRLDTTTAHTESAFFELTLDQQTEVFISVHQKLPRYMTQSPDYCISPVDIFVAEVVENNGIRKIAGGEKDSFVGKQTTYASEDIKIKLPEGKYVIRAKVKWLDEQQHGFSLSVFSQSEVTLKEANAKDYPNFLERMYEETGSRTKERYQLSNGCEFFSAWSGSHLWVYAFNGGNKTWDLQVKFTKMDNLKLCKKYSTESPDTLRLVIPPGQQKAGYAKRVSTERVEVLWTLEHEWK